MIGWSPSRPAVEPPPPVLGESRARVLTVLQDAGSPLGVTEVADRMRLHANTVRFHLDGLVESGLVQRMPEQREQPGRPRMLYQAKPGSSRMGQRSYRLLAEILTSYLAMNAARPAKDALEAGYSWGRYLAERPPPYRRTDTTAATSQLLRVLDDIGFSAELSSVGRRRQVLLHHCPFREAAEEHREVVCSIHLGLMKGLLDELEAPVSAERLEPFVEPSLCVAHLATRTQPPTPNSAAAGRIRSSPSTAGLPTPRRRSGSASA